MPQKSSDQKSLGLSVYLGMAKYAEPLTDRMKQKAVSAGEEDPVRISERHGKSELARGKSQLVWLHAADFGQSLPLIELIGRLSLELPEAQFLVTTTGLVHEGAMTARLPINAVHQYLPYDSPRAVHSFLEHWRPDICIWSENQLKPVLVKEVSGFGVPLVFVNAGISSKTNKKMRWMPGVLSPVLNSFSEILPVDPEAAENLYKLGVAKEKVTIAGVLCEGSTALPHDEAERARISKQFHGRPVWLAAHVHPDEERLILEAHKTASRLTHRLLTILSPEDPGQIPGLVKALNQSGLNYARRSQPESLSPLTNVLLGDVPGELGLWYRIASVSFVGSSLCPAGGRNPFEPAALGSAVIHGPRVENFADSYLKLARAGAAVEIHSVESLAEAISEVMSPDKAAEMAHAAWRVCSDGADVTDKIMASILSHLDRL
ncbi:MAG: 3-deoxy-D-manno-octulosonic acid transferase [Rhodobacteraceae bacterium]|nr:3-deoxy-D-manno-octulosonic acid transferase [Paracoccaceae bacterium]